MLKTPRYIEMVNKNKQTLEFNLRNYKSVPKFASNKFNHPKLKRFNKKSLRDNYGIMNNIRFNKSSRDNYENMKNIWLKNYSHLYLIGYSSIDYTSMLVRICDYNTSFVNRLTRYKPIIRNVKTYNAKNIYYDTDVYNTPLEMMTPSTGNRYVKNFKTYKFNGTTYNIHENKKLTTGLRQVEQRTIKVFELHKFLECKFNIIMYNNTDKTNGNNRYYLYNINGIVFSYDSALDESYQYEIYRGIDITSWFEEKNINFDDLCKNDELLIEIKIKFL